jgi:DNA-binding transcriptional regulator YiaG
MVRLKIVDIVQRLLHRARCEESFHESPWDRSCERRALMPAFFLKSETDSDASEHVGEIIRERAIVINKYRSLIGILDESNPHKWAQIIAAAREAGLGKDELCQEFSCSWSTILRWEAGRNVPGPFARRAIKEKLLQMLTALHDEELGRSKVLLVSAA